MATPTDIAAIARLGTIVAESPSQPAPQPPTPAPQPTPQPAPVPTPTVPGA